MTKGICNLCRGVKRRSLALIVVSLTRVDCEKSLRKELVSTKNPQEDVEISTRMAKRIMGAVIRGCSERPVNRQYAVSRSEMC